MLTGFIIISIIGVLVLLGIFMFRYLEGYYSEQPESYTSYKTKEHKVQHVVAITYKKNNMAIILHEWTNIIGNIPPTGKDSIVSSHGEATHIVANLCSRGYKLKSNADASVFTLTKGELL